MPGMLADVVVRVVPRPAVESCESGSKVPVARQLLSPLDDHVDQCLDDHPATQEKTNGDDNGSRQRAWTKRWKALRGEAGLSSESGGAATAAARSAGEAWPRGTLWRFAENRGRHDAMERDADGKLTLTEKRETKLDSDGVAPGTAQRDPETESELTEFPGEAAESGRTSEAPCSVME